MRKVPTPFRTIPIPVVLRRSGRNRRDLSGGAQKPITLAFHPCTNKDRAFCRETISYRTEIRRSWPRKPGLHDFQFVGRRGGDPGISVLRRTKHDPSPQTSSLNCCSRGGSRPFARTALFSDRGENQRRILCRSEDILVETQQVVPRSMIGGFQANQAIGSLLLPRLLVNAFLDQSGIEVDSSETGILTPAQRESLAKKAAVIFDVNPIVARIRLDSLSPLKGK